MENTISILIADDSKIIRDTIKHIIESSHVKDMCQITEAETGIETYNKVLKCKYDLLFMDIMMPNGDGLSILKKLDKVQNRPKTIIVSSINDQETTVQAFNDNADYYMVKPFSASMILREINNVLFKLNGDDKGYEILATNLLHMIGVRSNIKGYEYVRKALCIMHDNPDAMNHIVRDIYVPVAEEFNSTPSKVERSIRYAVQYSWDNCTSDCFSGIFEYHIQKDARKRPCNNEFLSTIYLYLEDKINANK